MIVDKGLIIHFYDNYLKKKNVSSARRLLFDGNVFVLHIVIFLVFMSLT